MKHSLKYLFALVILLGFPVAGRTEPEKKDQNFDLTAVGNLQRADRLHAKSSYNLGATGLRGWIYHTWPNDLPRTWTNEYVHWGLIDDQTAFAPYQILVTHIGANTPASSAGVFAVNDVIVGVNGKPFASDARKSFANAITEAEKTAGPNNLSILRWRAGVTSTVSLTLPKMGSYSATAPYNCPKTALILDTAAKNLHKQILKDGWGDSRAGRGAISALALLATGNPEYLPTLQAYARSIAPPTLDFETTGGPSAWDCYKSIFLAEYYMITGDKEVFHGLSEYVLFVAKHTSMFGTSGHGFSGVPPPAGWKAGGTHGSISWYGPVNNAGLVAQLSVVLGKKAGVVDSEIDPAIARAANFFGYYVNRGSIPYGEHEPWWGGGHGHGSNGKDAMAAVMFANIGDKPVQTEYYTRMAISAFSGEGYGHSGQGFSYLWTALAANMGGPTAAAEFQKKVLWHRDLARRCDGSFTYDGSEQFGCAEVDDYWTNLQYYDNPTAYYILHCAMPLKKLCITGKTVNPKTWLTPQAISNAIAAGEFPRISGGLTTAKLMSCLGDYDPIVRCYAAQDLGVRIKDRAALVPQLIAMADHPTDSNQREGACTALGYMGSADAIPVLVRRLTDKELFVRARAAKALSELKSERAALEPQIPAMLAAFVANVAPTYPYEKGFNWSDPLQISNGYLAETLFDKLADLTIKADKKLLWPAIRAGIKQPAGMWRSKLSDFVEKRLTLEDVKALVGDLIEDANLEAPCDRMFTVSPTVAAASAMAKFHIQEGLEIYKQSGSGGLRGPGLDALKSYGDAARWALPKLNEYLATWNPSGGDYAALAGCVAAIKSATSAPTLVAALPVASSQVVAAAGAKPINLSGEAGTGVALSYTIVTPPAHGTLAGTPPKVTYTPAANYRGTDHFTFKVNNGSCDSKPGTVSLIVGVAGTGLKGEYFNNADFTAPKVSRIDPMLNFDWSTTAPAPSMDPDTFSVRWTGQVMAPETGTYQFSTLGADGVRLWVNGAMVIHQFKEHPLRWTDGMEVTLLEGQRYDLRLECYKNVGPAAMKLKWSGPSFAGDNGVLIDKEWLYPDAAAKPNGPAVLQAQSVTTAKGTDKIISLNSGYANVEALTYVIASAPAHGTLRGSPPNLTYSPAPDFTGADSFTFKFSRGKGLSAPATVGVMVTPGSPAAKPIVPKVEETASDRVVIAAGKTFELANAKQLTSPMVSMQGGTMTLLTTLRQTDDKKLVTVVLAPGTTNTMDTSRNGPGEVGVSCRITGAGALVLTGERALVIDGSVSDYTGGTKVTLAAGQKLAVAGNKAFGAGLVTFAGAGGSTAMSVASSNAAEIPNDLCLESNLIYSQTYNNIALQLKGDISGPGSLTKTYDAADKGTRLQLRGLNSTYSGGTIFKSGYLDVVGPWALGSGPVTMGGKASKDHVVAFVNLAPVTLVNEFVLAGISEPTLTDKVALTEFQVNWDLELTGNISGTGGLLKTGAKKLTLSGVNTCTGPVRVGAGVLAFGSATAVGRGPVTLADGAKLQLDYRGTRQIAALTVDGAKVLPRGTYGSSTSYAAIKDDKHFVGSGMVTVGAEAQMTTVTTLVLATGASPSAPKAPVTFTATVAGRTPKGSVTFYAGSKAIGTVVLNGAFQASVTTDALAPGWYSISASYEGDAMNLPGSSAPLGLRVGDPSGL